MKSIDLRHRLAAVLLAVCLVVCCALPAFATSASLVSGRLGSLHVRLYDTHNDVPLRGGELTLYQVAAVKRTGRQPVLRLYRRFYGLRRAAGRSFRQHAG